MKTTTDRCQYIISEYDQSTKRAFWVCAPPGYYRSSDSSLKCDGCFKGGPEWTQNRSHAHKFTTYLSAARVQGKCPSARVHPILQNDPRP
jgi:hypothetical protein